MLYYRCSKCKKTFSALNPKNCPYCQHTNLQILSNYKVQVYNTSDIKSSLNKYITKFELQPNLIDDKNAISDITCKILQLPSISTRHCIDNPYINRIKRITNCSKKNFETPFTVELRLYSPQRAYVLIDSESNEIIDYLIAQYKSMGWDVIDLSKSQVSFIKIIHKYLKTHIVPRIENDVVRKDILCIINDSNGDSSDNDLR